MVIICYSVGFVAMKGSLAKVLLNLDASLKRSDLTTRPEASDGTWVAFLLPAIIVVAACRETSVSDSFRFAAVIGSGLFGATTVFISYLGTTEKNARRFSPLFYIPAIITSSLFFFSLKEGTTFSLVCGLGASFSYFIGLPILLQKFPRSFTFGEASVVVQALVIFILTSIVNIIRVTDVQRFSDLEKATLILQVGLLGCGVIILVISHFSICKQIPGFCLTVLTVAFGFVVPLLHYFFKGSPILWIIQLIISKPMTVALVIYWVCCCAVAVFAVNYQLNTQKAASTVVRKNFHYLIVAVYLPGIIVDKVFLYLSTGVIFAVFLLMEAIRVLKVRPLGSILQSSFEIFADEKDQGVLALTPIFLLVGCSLPLWIHPKCFQVGSEGFLLAISGVLSVGIGDTAASIGGTHFGKHKWPGSKKSIEGTLISILSQSFVVICFVYMGFITLSTMDLLWTFAAVILTSVLEANTDQVDNLVLPLVQLLLLL